MPNDHRVSITFSPQGYPFPIHTAQTLTRFSDANAKAWVTSDVVAQRMIKARVLAWIRQTFEDDQFVLAKQDVASNIYSAFVQFLVPFPSRSHNCGYLISYFGMLVRMTFVKDIVQRHHPRARTEICTVARYTRHSTSTFHLTTSQIPSSVTTSTLEF